MKEEEEEKKDILSLLQRMKNLQGKNRRAIEYFNSVKSVSISVLSGC